MDSLEQQFLSEAEAEELDDQEAAPTFQQAAAGPTSNTGPKGVINDFRIHSMIEKEKQRLSKIKLIHDTKKRAMIIDHDDIAALEKYEQQRLKELLNQSRGTKRIFGSVTQISQSEFVDAIEKEHPSITVLIFLYEPFMHQCSLVNGYFTKMAEKYAHAKFLRIQASEADKNFDSIALPAIQAYKNGNLILNWIRIQDDLERNNEDSDSNSDSENEGDSWETGFEKYLLDVNVLRHDQILNEEISFMSASTLTTSTTKYNIGPPPAAGVGLPATGRSWNDIMNANITITIDRNSAAIYVAVSLGTVLIWSSLILCCIRYCRKKRKNSAKNKAENLKAKNGVGPHQVRPKSSNNLGPENSTINSLASSSTKSKITYSQSQTGIYSVSSVPQTLSQNSIYAPSSGPASRNNLLAGVNESYNSNNVTPELSNPNLLSYNGNQQYYSNQHLQYDSRAMMAQFPTSNGYGSRHNLNNGQNGMGSMSLAVPVHVKHNKIMNETHGQKYLMNPMNSTLPLNSHSNNLTEQNYNQNSMVQQKQSLMNPFNPTVPLNAQPLRLNRGLNNLTEPNPGQNTMNQVDPQKQILMNALSPTVPLNRMSLPSSTQLNTLAEPNHKQDVTNQDNSQKQGSMNPLSPTIPLNSLPSPLNTQLNNLTEQNHNENTMNQVYSQKPMNPLSPTVPLNIQKDVMNHVFQTQNSTISSISSTTTYNLMSTNSDHKLSITETISLSKHDQDTKSSDSKSSASKKSKNIKSITQERIKNEPTKIPETLDLFKLQEQIKEDQLDIISPINLSPTGKKNNLDSLIFSERSSVADFHDNMVKSAHSSRRNSVENVDESIQMDTMEYNEIFKKFTGNEIRSMKELPESGKHENNSASEVHARVSQKLQSLSRKSVILAVDDVTDTTSLAIRTAVIKAVIPSKEVVVSPRAVRKKPKSTRSSAAVSMVSLQADNILENPDTEIHSIPQIPSQYKETKSDI